MVRRRQEGAALLYVLTFVTLLVVLTTIFVATVCQTMARVHGSRRKLQALNVAEAGVERAIYALVKSKGTYRGVAGSRLDEGAFSVHVRPVDGQASAYRISSTGVFPVHVRGARRTVHVTISFDPETAYPVTIARWEALATRPQR